MYQTYLECNHCGSIAIEADDDNLFWDGSGGACQSCGFPGQVSCCSETAAWWNESEEEDARCTDLECVECELNGA